MASQNEVEHLSETCTVTSSSSPDNQSSTFIFTVPPGTGQKYRYLLRSVNAVYDKTKQHWTISNECKEKFDTRRATIDSVSAVAKQAMGTPSWEIAMELEEKTEPAHTENTENTENTKNTKNPKKYSRARSLDENSDDDEDDGQSQFPTPSPAVPHQPSTLSATPSSIIENIQLRPSSLSHWTLPTPQFIFIEDGGSIDQWSPKLRNEDPLTDDDIDDYKDYSSDEEEEQTLLTKNEQYKQNKQHK
jgi:hypothetical protein